MKKCFYILTLGLLAVLASCSDEVVQALESDSVKCYSQFFANIVDEMADTRSLLLNDKKIAFEENDAIQLYVDEDIKIGKFYTLKYQKSSNSFNVGPGYAPIPGTQFNAIFPSGAAFNPTNKVYVINLEHNNKFRRDTFSATQLMPMWGDGKGANVLNFYHMAGLIRFSISGSLKISKLTLKGNNGEQIGGAAEIDPTQAKPTLKMANMYSSLPPAYEQVMTVENVELTETPTYFYFVVPPITFTQGITLTIEAEGLHHPIVKTTDKTVKIGRGMMKTFTSVDVDDILQAESDVQLNALKALYHSMGGDKWTSKKWDITKPLSDSGAWPGVVANEKGVVTQIDLKGCGLTGTIPADIGDLIYLQEIDLSNNNLTGGIPKEVANITNLKSFYVNNNKMDGEVPKEVYTSDTWAHATRKLNQQAGYNLNTKYVSADYSHDGEWKILQTHTSGKGYGIPVVITCDAFSDGKYADFNTEAVNAMNYFFSIAPYNDFREYFDVYSLMAVSPNNEVGLNLAYGTVYDGDSYSIDYKKVMRKIETSPLGMSSNVLAIVLLNETNTVRRAKCFINSDGFSVAIAPVDENLEVVIHHEAGGHGFGFLADEYYLSGRVYGSAERADLDNRHNLGWSLNLSYNNTKTAVPWKDLWIPAYEPENIGVYAGGDGSYSSGVYRCTENSTMRDQYEFDKFNPQSRWLIFRRIVEMAGYATPSIDDFMTYDAHNISYLPPVATTRNYVEKQEHLLGAPPVMLK
ncbi:MAG: hypothetical protein J6U14_05110 [Bacteroidaceae bacterium]|nr:hypothetical protein [Bacteroidaceae bacterium]